jgi:hypothetical protein
MVYLKLIRENVHEKKKYTRGRLYFNGEFFAYTLEDKIRDKNADGDLNDYKEGKVYGNTAIPFGTYQGFLRYSPSKDRIVPQLENVKHFTYIQIHSGNDISDTLGCILIGYKRKGDKIWESFQAERDLVRKIQLDNEIGTFKIEIL